MCVLNPAVMSITVAIMSMAFERLWVVLPASPYFDSLQSLGFTLMIMLCGGIIAFFMVWTEFAVIANTSALTFMIAGTFKELVTGLSPLYPPGLISSLTVNLESIGRAAYNSAIARSGPAHLTCGASPLLFGVLPPDLGMAHSMVTASLVVQSWQRFCSWAST